MKYFTSKRRKYILLSLAFLSALALAATILLPYVVDINDYKEFLVSKAEEQLHRQVSIEKIQLHLINGIGIRCTGVIIGDLDGQGEFISAKNVFLKFKPLPLLKKELVIKRITLDHPRINIKRDAKGKFNLLAPKTEEGEEIKWSLPRFTVGRIAISKGEVQLIDEAVDDREVLTEIKNLNLTARKFEPGRPFDLTLSAELGRGENIISHVELSARIAGLAEDSIDPAKINLTAKARITNFDARIFVPYYKKYLPYDDLSAIADLDIDYQGNLADNFKLKAKGNAKSVKLIYSKLFAEPLTCRTAQAQVDLTLKDERLDLGITGIKVDTGQFNTTGQLYLNDLLSDKKSIKLKASCSPFTFEASKPYIPFKTIPPKVAAFINNSFSGGVFEDLSTTLDGEIHRFRNIDKPENYCVLAASARFRNLNMELAEHDYKFEQINGSVDLREGIIAFDELTANLENSHLKIYNSRITDLYSHPRFEIHSTSDLSLDDKYLRGILPFNINEKMKPQGRANLDLQAKGKGRELALKGVFNLDRVSYGYGSRLKKEAGPKNSLAFDARLLDWQTHKLHRLTYSLGGSRALINVEQTEPVRFDLQTDKFDIKDLKLIMPNLFTQDDKGFITADVRVSDKAENSSGISITGNINLRQGKLQLAKHLLKLEGDGQLQFSIQGKPDALQISAETDLTQAAYSYKKRSKKPRGQKNVVSFHGMLKNKRTLEFKNLLFALESSEANLTGTISDLTSLESELKVTANNIDLSHITSLVGNLLPDKVKISSGYLDMDLGVDGPLTDTSKLALMGDVRIYSAQLSRDVPPFRLDGLSAKLNYPGDSATTIFLQTEQGNYEKFKFSNLIGAARLRKSRLLVKALSLDAYQGSLSLKGRLNYPPTPLRFDFCFTAEKMDLKQVIQELDIIKDGVITGRLAAAGQLSNTGEGKNKFGGLNGMVKLELTNGIIKRYGVLAKIFSMISPSALFDSGMPDFGSEGFPYKKMRGCFKVVNGVASTEGFVLTSDAWRIITLGEIDLTNEIFDLKVYVQPFQMIDGIISKIPIAGNILQGETGGFLDTFFVVEGSFDSPEVTSKPIISLAEKVFGIIRRTLTLPFTIFSD